ncbi:zinc ABC transporter substrate-binding protein [Tessaracoccus terricola]
MQQRATRFLPVAIIMATALVGCAPAAGSDDRALSVVTTTGYLADVVSQVAPEADVTTLVGPGGDPHTYQPSTRDIQTILDADLVLWNGLRLEAQMADVLLGQGERQLAVAEALPDELLLPLPGRDADGNHLSDPHVWNSPEAWALVVGEVADRLAEVDPDAAGQYRGNAESFAARIAAAGRWAEDLLAPVPEADRTLVTGHDAFNYYGHTYRFRVHATDFISTDAQLSATQLSELADLVATEQVPVVFADNQANPQAITSLAEAVAARGWRVEVSESELYADSLGAGEDVDSWLEVFEHNTRAIAAALGVPEEER